MTHLWILLSAVLLVGLAAEPVSSPEENENEVLKETEEENTESQVRNGITGCQSVRYRQISAYYCAAD